jgi:hypothetical protein
LLAESASGFLKNRDAVMGLTPRKLGNLCEPGFARLRSFAFHVALLSQEFRQLNKD